MFKLTEANDLEKAGHSIGSFFLKNAEELSKTFEFHKAMAGKCEACAKAHAAHGVDAQAAHDGADDGDAHKAFMGKAAAFHKEMSTHHAEMAGHHHAQAETHKAAIDAMKVLASDWGGPTVKAANGTSLSGEPGAAPTGVQAMLQATSDALLKKTLESFDTDPEVANFVRKFALEQMTSALGNKIVPDNVRGMIPNFPSITAVPRTGQRQLNQDKVEVPLEFEKLFSIDDDR